MKFGLKNKLSFEEVVFYYILSLTLFIDFLNGIWIKFVNPNISLGQFIRVLVTMFCIYCIFKYNSTKSKRILYFFSIIFFLGINFLFYNKFFNIYSSFKLIYFLVLTLAIFSLYDAKKFQLSTIVSSINNNLYILPILILTSYVLNIGSSSYTKGFGYKGSFISLNGLNISMIVLLIFAIEKEFNKFKYIKKFLMLVYIIIPTIFLGTKSSILFSIFSFILYFVYNKIYKINSINNDKSVKNIYSYIGIILIIIFLILNNYSYLILRKILERQIYFIQFTLQKTNNYNIITYLLSTRNIFLREISKYFLNNFSIIKIFIGSGAFEIQKELAHILGLNGLKSIEMDLFDIFFYYGIIGVILTYGFCVYIFIKNIPKENFKVKRPFFISFICIIIFSILGGHVFFQPMSSTFLSISLCGLYMKGFNNKDENNRNLYDV
ncbi:O-antigen ligase family protein [Clostridium prolinivorans]|uniref:O-antigen ligase family protein n=1 Tax=Clostridium prolinivorans TaxID=2769420 RepID=UPI000FDB87DE